MVCRSVQGDELFELTSEITKRHKAVVNMPKTIWSIKKVLEHNVFKLTVGEHSVFIHYVYDMISHAYDNQQAL